MNSKLLVATLAFTLLSAALNAQNVLEGTVKNELGEPLIGAAVQIIETSQGAVTKGNGAFRIRNLKAGTYFLRFSFLGYETITREIEVKGATVLDVTLNRSTYLSEQYTVTAYRASDDAPVSQVTRGLKEIETLFQGQDAGFLLEELSPSIVTYSESGTNFSNYSGFRLRGMDQTRVNMTLNGVPLNDMIDQGVFFSNFTDFGNSIQSVQIQRGVGTSSNGISSYAGSINFESLNVYDTVPSAEIQLSGGSFGTLRASAEIQTGRMENNMAFYARYAGMTSDGYRDNTSTDSRSFFLSGAYFAKRHTLKFTGFVGRSQNGLAYFPVPLENIRQNPRTNLNNPNDVDDFGQWMTQLQHTYQISEQTSLVSTVYYNGAGGDFPFGFDDAGTFTQINYPLYNSHLGAMSNLNWSSLDNTSQLTLGLHGYTFGRENVEQIIPNFNDPYYEDESRKNEFSTFIKGSKGFGSLTLFGDIQLRTVSLDLQPDEEFLGQQASIPTRDWLFVNPKAGVSYSLSNQASVYVSVGRTGREPTRFDILASTQINLDNLLIAQDLDAVEAEYVNDIELGTRIQGSDFSVNANAFFMQFENEIAQIGEFISQGFVQVYENQESSYRAGVEVDYSWYILQNLRLHGNATWMQSRISRYSPEGSDVVFTDVSPILSPEWNIRSSLELGIIENLTIAASVRYLGESFMELTNDPSFMVPESFITDFGVRYKFYREHEIRVDVNNIFDDLYYTNGAPVALQDGSEVPGFFVQPPRNLFVTLALKF